MSVLTRNSISYSNAALEDRCAPRTPVKIQAKLRRSSEAAFNVTVGDLSCAGFSCDAVTSIKPGTMCWLNLPGLMGMQAEVIWNDGTTVGCAFATFMNQGVVDRMVALYPPPSVSHSPYKYSSSR
jgi:hypothetical protein